MAVNWGSLIPLITAGVSTAGQIAAARQAGRQAQAQAQQGVDTLNQRAHETDMAVRQRALEAIDAARLERALGALKEYELSLQAPQARASNAVRGDILANVQDVTVSHPRANVVNFQGGLRPSLLSPDTRMLGRQMAREALLSQLAGTPTPYSHLPEADFSSVLNAPGAPRATPLPQGSRLDSILQNIGQYGALGASILERLPQTRRTGQTPSVTQITGPAQPPQQMPGAFMPVPAPPPGRPA